MKKLFFILLASSGFAVLPPLAQSTREIKALLSDAQFYESFGSAQMIREIVRNEGGYLVTTQDYAMQVDVQYIRDDSKRCGPARFEFKFQPPYPILAQ
jgi:hypothetical protein